MDSFCSSSDRSARGNWACTRRVNIRRSDVAPVFIVLEGDERGNDALDRQKTMSTGPGLVKEEEEPKKEGNADVIVEPEARI